MSNKKGSLNMNWTNFLSAVRQSELGHYYYRQPATNETVKTLAIAMELSVNCDQFAQSQSREDLTKCYASIVILCDLLSLQLADTKRDIYGDEEEARFVDLRRLAKHATEIQGYIIRQLKAGEAINRVRLSSLTLMLSTALVDCAYSYGWKPDGVMEI